MKNETTPAAVAEQRAATPKLPGGITGKGFTPGKSGNPSGRKKDCASIAASIKRQLSRPDADAIAARLIQQARRGNLNAAKVLLDRLDGPLAGPLAVAFAMQTPASPTGLIKVRHAHEIQDARLTGCDSKTKHQD
jgi:hypothetical protein